MATVKQLKAALAQAGLSTEGKKSVLQERLDQHLSESLMSPKRPGDRNPDNPNYDMAGRWIGPE